MILNLGKASLIQTFILKIKCCLVVVMIHAQALYSPMAAITKQQQLLSECLMTTKYLT